MTPETEALIREILWRVWVWIVQSVDWFMTQPTKNLVAFLGIAVVFLISNLLSRSSKGKPASEYVPILITMHTIFIPVVIALGLHFVWGYELKFLIAKLIAVIALVWFFALINFLAVRSSSLLGRVVWTVIGLFVVPFTYFSCVWVLLEAPLGF